MRSESSLLIVRLSKKEKNFIFHAWFEGLSLFKIVSQFFLERLLPQDDHHELWSYQFWCKSENFDVICGIWVREFIFNILTPFLYGFEFDSLDILQTLIFIINSILSFCQFLIFIASPLSLPVRLIIKFF